MRPDRLLSRIRAGHVRNVRFGDLRRLLEKHGFVLDRVRGSHHLFVHPDLGVVVNLQDVSGKAKPYQVRQVRGLFDEYHLGQEER